MHRTNSGIEMTPTETLNRLRDRLATETRAEVRLDSASRGLYATDASLYQIEPVGVAIPRTVADVPAIVRAAFEEGVAIVPRGAATSLSGQTVGAGLVLDFSKYLNRIGIVDRDRMTVRVEPGVVLDQLNRHLAPLGLMFAPDVSTSDRATIGGMIGNNSAGARSLRYGKTVDHVRSLDVVLDDGTPARFEPLDVATLQQVCRHGDRAGILHATVRDVVARHEAAIRAQFPRILRRVSGYNLDEFVPGLAVRPAGWPDEPWQFNLSRLIVGSEGTLAIVTGAELRVVPKPACTGLVVLSFASINDALGRIEEMVAAGPVAVELLDRTILDLAATQPALASHLHFAAGRPAAILAAQFYADSAAELAERAQSLARAFEGRDGVLGVRTALDGAAGDSFWKVRKAGLSLLMGMVGDAKPVAFVEDTAVAPAKLLPFYQRFEAIVQRHGAKAACYGHADVGCLHIRPILNMKDPADLEKLRGIAAEVAELVAEFGGAMSGEHGDGLARSRWNERLFGPEVYSAFQEIKHAFDPRDRLNPGKVVAAPDLTDHLRISPRYRTTEPDQTAFDFAAQGGFARAVELCSGVGVCRKLDTGTMCPSYMVTRDEADTTRGRANLLRLVISGQRPDGLANEELHAALDLCLQCKACKTECPSNVDMARLKAEVLYQTYRHRPAPLASLAMSHYARLARLASPLAPLVNALGGFAPNRWLLEKLAGIDRRRRLPRFARPTFRGWFNRHQPTPPAGSRGRVILFDDCFTNYHAPEVGRAAVRVIEAAGYEVELAGGVCCGRPAASKGLLDVARDQAAETLGRLARSARAGMPILGLEPSCLTMFVDEYRDLRLGPDAELLARRSRLVEAWVGDPAAVPDLPLRPLPIRLLLHGHCQQKAILGLAETERALRRIPGVTLRTLDSGCCGMAGSFGYEKGHYELSEALARRVLIPAAEADLDATLVAPGFSCRSQVKDLEGLQARHPIEVLAEALDDSRRLPG
ncbi:MAG: oxidoreductase [Isosphaeraceae bacterium]|jgi:FAD/FMN-containing dehydrogenase/Fe-S oxidoreductase|nr:MAG: oxidoreductase [Isosphaeraceae bacterium]